MVRKALGESPLNKSSLSPFGPLSKGCSGRASLRRPPPRPSLRSPFAPRPGLRHHVPGRASPPHHASGPPVPLPGRRLKWNLFAVRPLFHLTRRPSSGPASDVVSAFAKRNSRFIWLRRQRLAKPGNRTSSPAKHPRSERGGQSRQRVDGAVVVPGKAQTRALSNAGHATN